MFTVHTGNRILVKLFFGRVLSQTYFLSKRLTRPHNIMDAWTTPWINKRMDDNLEWVDDNLEWLNMNGWVNVNLEWTDEWMNEWTSHSCPHSCYLSLILLYAANISINEAVCESKTLNLKPWRYLRDYSLQYWLNPLKVYTRRVTIHVFAHINAISHSSCSATSVAPN